MSLRGFLEMRNNPASNAEAPKPALPTSESRPRILRSEELLRGDCTLQIAHGEEVYTLRKTRGGKLYLVK